MIPAEYESVMSMYRNTIEAGFPGSTVEADIATLPYGLLLVVTVKTEDREVCFACKADKLSYFNAPYTALECVRNFFAQPQGTRA